MLAQLGGQGRLAVGAILGAATAALCLLAVSTGDDTMAAPENPFPLARNVAPATAGPQVTTTIMSTGPATTPSTTTRPAASSAAPTVVPTTAAVVLTSDPPQPTTVPTTDRPPPTTVPRTSRPRPTPPPNPCWFIFC